MAPRLSSDLAAGFKHCQWRKGGDTAFQANTLPSGFATTVGGSPQTEKFMGSSTSLLVQVGCPQQGRKAPGTVVAPEHFPQPQHQGLGAQEDHPAPTNPICIPLFSRLPCRGTALQAFVQTLSQLQGVSWQSRRLERCKVNV